jgi:hypothetical protein
MEKLEKTAILFPKEKPIPRHSTQQFEGNVEAVQILRKELFKLETEKIVLERKVREAPVAAEVWLLGKIPCLFLEWRPKNLGETT